MNIGAIKLRGAAADQVVSGQTWMLCDGRAINRITYGTLFALIGISYGPGDGATTFNIPNFGNAGPITGRLPVGASGAGYALGAAAGADIHNHTTSLWAALAHAATGGLNTGVTIEAGIPTDNSGGPVTPADELHGHSWPAGIAAHPAPANTDDATSLPPYQAVGFLIRVL